MSSSNDSRISRRTPMKTQNEIQRDIDKAKSKKTLTIVILVCVAILALALIFINTGLFYRSATAVTVGDRQFSIADFNYYYKTAFNNTYNSIYSTYGNYASYILDASKPLDQQKYNSDMTWEEYFSQVAVSKMRTVVMLNKLAAEDEGFSLTDEQQQAVNALGDIPAAYAKAYKLSTGKYLRNLYGKGVNKSLYIKNATEMYIADAYTQYLKDNYDYSDADIEAYYTANTRKFDTVTYAAYLIRATTGDGIDAEKALENAREAAQLIADSSDSLDALKTNIGEYEKTNGTTVAASNGNYSSEDTLDESYADWLCDPSRVSGDITVIESKDKTGYYVVYFDSVDDRDYPSAKIRQILVSAASGDDGSYSDEALKAAHDKAEELLAEWQSGEKTEESFQKLYTDRSSEERISSTVIDMIYHGATGVDDVETWALEADRQPGDVTLVDTSYGTHLLYYISARDNARKALVTSAKADEDYSKWVESNIESYPAIINKLGYYFTRNV